MRITSKGQVTIPQDIRDNAGLLPGTEVQFVVERGVVKLMKAKVAARKGKPTRGERIVSRLWGAGSGKMTTDEIMALTRGE